MRWQSEITDYGLCVFPEFAGIRVLMMPFSVQDPARTLPAYMRGYVPMVEQMRAAGRVGTGLAYLTIDEREVPAGACHRRPGLHVDGWRDDIGMGVWGGSNWAGGFGGYGMLMAASHVGAVAWAQEFNGEPATFGDCEGLRYQCCSKNRCILEAGRIYHCGPMTVHESIPAAADMRRQFVRLSLPSDGEWPVSCTPNPLGIMPARTAAPRPAAFTDYAPMRK